MHWAGLQFQISFVGAGDLPLESLGFKARTAGHTVNSSDVNEKIKINSTTPPLPRVYVFIVLPFPTGGFLLCESGKNSETSPQERWKDLCSELLGCEGSCGFRTQWQPPYARSWPWLNWHFICISTSLAHLCAAVS